MAGTRTFGQVDHLLTRDKRFRAVEDQRARHLLLYLYVSPNNYPARGLVQESADEMARFTGIDRDDVPKLLKGLEDAGRLVYRDGHAVLCDWRRWTGGYADKDGDGLALVTKQMVQWVQDYRDALDDDVVAAYVEASDFDDEKAFFAVLDAAENRGGDRRSKRARRRREPERERESEPEPEPPDDDPDDDRRDLDPDDDEDDFDDDR